MFQSPWTQLRSVELASSPKCLGGSDLLGAGKVTFSATAISVLAITPFSRKNVNLFSRAWIRMRDASFLKEMGLDEFRAAEKGVSEACSVERIEAG
jgi:hypothetical protein